MPALLALLAVAAAFSPTAHAETLVTNFNIGGSSGNVNVDDERIVAQAFTTGRENNGIFDLTDVRLSVTRSISPGEIGDLTVSIAEASSNGVAPKLNTDLVVLENQAVTTSRSGTFTFSVPTGTTIRFEADTTYWVVVKSSDTEFRFSTKLSDDEHADGRSDWSIGNHYQYFEDNMWHGHSAESLSIQVLGDRLRNSAASGQPTISGTLAFGNTLTAETGDIEDEDGLDDAEFRYQWILVGASAYGRDIDIPGATKETFRVDQFHRGGRFKVRVEFEDDLGFSESRTSDESGVVSMAASETALMENLGKDFTGTASAAISAQGFRTATHYPGWELNSVAIDFNGGNTADDLVVEIRESTRTPEEIHTNEVLTFVRRPGGYLATLQNPSGLSGGGVKTFTANGTVWLEPWTEYFVVVRRLVGEPIPRLDTTAQRDTPDGDPRFSGHLSYGRWTSSTGRVGDWSLSSSSLGIRVRATPVFYSRNAKLDSVEVEDAHGDSHDFTRTFSPDREAHEVRVPNRVETVTLRVEPEDGNVAGIDFYDESRPPNQRQVGSWNNLPNLPPVDTVETVTQEFAVKPGRNEFRIHVTAQDTQASREYVVQVIRDECSASDIWCGKMRVEEFRESGNTFFGYVRAAQGSLSPGTFRHDGTQYRLGFVVLAPSGTVEFGIASQIGVDDSIFDDPAFSLLIDGRAFPLAGTYDGTKEAYLLTGTDVAWEDGERVQLRLIRGGGGGGSRGQREPESYSATPLIASLDSAPDSHDGDESFRVRVAFSEDIATSYRVLKHGFKVSGGSITSVKRVDKRSDLWELEVSPDSDDDVTLVLAAGQACTVEGAPCTGDTPPRQLANTLAVTVPGPEDEDAPVPLTVRVHDQPSEHDGSPFDVYIAFSAPITAGMSKFPQAFDVTDGAVERTRRVDGRSDLWRVRVRPDGFDDVKVLLRGNRPCGSGGVPCAKTADGQGRIPLSHDLSATVRGQPAISVADAEATEGTDATMAFQVSLDKSALDTMTVDYATRDGTATAGEDYTATSGTLTFDVGGSRTQTVRVTILNDEHHDDGETFELVLSNPSGARIADGTATGTIHNADAMPRAWMARFGRTVAEQVLDAVEDRVQAPRTPGAEVSLAGERLGLGPLFGAEAEGDALATEAAARAAREEEQAAREAQRIADWLRGETDPERQPGLHARTVAPGELLTGSSFALTAGAGGGPGGTVSLWGRGAVTGFDGREGDLSVDGEVTSAFLGADWSRTGSGAGAATAGLILGHSRGDGGYRGEAGGGTVTSTLTGVYPWARYALSERISVRGVAGYGEGQLTLTPVGADGSSRAALRTDLHLLLAAAGLRGVLVAAPAGGGFELAVRTDALGVRTTTAKVAGLSAEDAEVTRLRLGLEGSWAVGFAGGGTLTPSLEIGARHDGGDAETGYGADLGGGLAWSDPARGLSAEVRGRGLLSHAAEGFRERGLSGAVSFDPAPDSARGLALTLRRTAGGASSGGMDALLGRGTLAGLAAAGDGDDLAYRHFEMRIGYGLAAFGDRFTMTPELGFGSSAGAREYTLGWKLVLENRGRGPGSLDVALEARRHEGAGAAPGAAERAAGITLRARW